MFNAAATRRTSLALTRDPRVPTISSRTIAISVQPRPLQRITQLTSLNLYNQNRVSHFIFHRHGLPATPQIRSLSYLQRTKLGLQKASKGIWRKNPIMLPLAIISVIGAALIFAYIAYVEITQVGPQYHKFPPPVAKSLRTAVYYTDVDLNPHHALKAYKEALRTAMQMGMHPFSDEVLGIKLQTAMMLEKAGLVKSAVEVLERTKAESLLWIEDGRKQAAERQAEEEKLEKQRGDKPGLEVTNPELQDMYEKMKQQDAYEERQRDKAMKKAVGISMKLAELYASDYMQQPEKAEAAQVAAVELALKELEFRKRHGLPIGGGTPNSDAWLNRMEIVTALSELGGTYMEGKPDLALPLLLRALDLLRAEEGPKPTCKQAVLITNISTALYVRANNPIPGEDSEALRGQALNTSGQWAKRVLEITAKVPASEKDEDCDRCAVGAMYTLGSLADAQDDLKEAEKWYRDGLALAKKIYSEDEDVIPTLEKALKDIGKPKLKPE